MMHLFTQFLLALFATLGFAIIFRVPVRHIPACIIVGGLGWITYLITDYNLAAWLSAAVVVVCDVYAGVFLYRLLRTVIKVCRLDAFLLSDASHIVLALLLPVAELLSHHSSLNGLHHCLHSLSSLVSSHQAVLA